MQCTLSKLAAKFEILSLYSAIIPCKYKNMRFSGSSSISNLLGCTKTVMFKNIDEHETSCEFRPIYCFQCGCQQERIKIALYTITGKIK